MNKVSKETIIFISGCNGVGKTTTARKLLQNHPEFIIVQNTDIVREIIRNTYTKFPICKDELEILNKSASELTYDELYQQSNILSDTIVSICNRLAQKKLPSIIEGVNICYESLINNNEFQKFIGENNSVFFVNLYISDKQELFYRIRNRRIDDFTVEKQLKCFENIFVNNKKLYDVACSINSSRVFKHKIININVNSGGLSEQENLNRIVSIIEERIIK